MFALAVTYPWRKHEYSTSLFILQVPQALSPAQSYCFHGERDNYIPPEQHYTPVAMWNSPEICQSLQRD